MNISDWLKTIGSGVEEFAENHVGLPIILILLALMALFRPEVVYEFFFPTKRRRNETD